ncbi:MAG: hypothetical protein L3J44_08480 [Campylobacteraceae bacterium]|nr:hypothetical protein [Campylobacteraceae bacterium]
MNQKNRIRLKTSEIFGNYNYPEQSWNVPSWVAKNENFLEVLKDVISSNIFDNKYKEPESFRELFSYLRGKNYAIFDERFLVCLTQGRLAYLTNSGFSKVSASEDIFELSNWRVQI